MDDYDRLLKAYEAGLIPQSDYSSLGADLANRVTDPNDPRQEYARQVYEYMRQRQNMPLETEEDILRRKMMQKKIMEDTQRRQNPGVYQMLRELIKSKLGR